MSDRNEATHAADRLLDAIDKIGAPVCVGIDPVAERLPRTLRRSTDDPDAQPDAIEQFSREIVQAVKALVPVVKFQSACFERYGATGVAALERSIDAAADAGLVVILDAKRGDIGLSSEHYAAAAFERAGTASPDWITIHTYLGEDGLRPFLHPGRGAFALVRTSNPGANAVQEAHLDSGSTVAEHIAEIVARTGNDAIGERGFSALGAVVAATDPASAARLRAIMPRQVFLVPGFGAQGGTIDDVLPCFNQDGSGALITASRSIIYAFNDTDTGWRGQITDAAAAFADTIGRAVGLR